MPPTMDPGPEPPVPPERERGFRRVRRALLGGPKNLHDPHLFHSLSLAAFLAWVGLGADGLSSSAYGPEEAFKNLGDHQYLAVFLAALTAITVVVIAASYSRIIEHFPFGGGGYVVASRLLGPRAGVISGSALLVDYVLTITTSIAAGGEAVFSNLPQSVHSLKLPVEFVVIVLLTVLNLRGVKESVRTLVPIFLIFLATHVVMIGGSVLFHLGRAEEVAPRVAAAKRTMIYMAVSLALTAAGIILGYLLMDVHPVPGKTMNAVLADRLAGSWNLAGIPLGHGFVVITLTSEALLLFVAAQAGFIDGPRVMANMAHDSWLPHRFGALSSRLTMQNGVLLIGATSLYMLWHTGGSVDALVVMYSINVFVTFSLSQAGMIRYWWMKDTRRKYPDWARHLPLHLIGFVLCFGILVVNVLEKFTEGAWLTVVVTGAVVSLCMLIKRHYLGVRARLGRLDQILTALPQTAPKKALELQKKKPTAVLLVGGFSGLGIHALLTIMRLFPRYFVNVVFMSVGVVDSATFQGVEEVDRVREQTEEALRRYVELARGIGMPADYRFSIGTEAVSESEKLAGEVAKEYERSIFFAGKLIFERERWWDRLLHNETANQVQRRLQFAGLPMVILPVRVLE